MKTAMDQPKAEDLKRRLSLLASNEGKDLCDPANKCTLWLRTRAGATDKIEFINGAVSMGALFDLAAKTNSYVFQMLENVLILDAEGQNHFIVREYSCSEG